jgi:predicted transposase YbfD/YdcC
LQKNKRRFHNVNYGILIVKDCLGCSSSARAVRCFPSEEPSMIYPAARTFKLQDGSLCNLERRFKKNKKTLIYALSQIEDGRSGQGKRHSLVSILMLIFCATSAGCKNLAECVQWAKVPRNFRFLKKLVDFPHGVPHPTTISRAIQVCDANRLAKAFVFWQFQVFGIISPGICLSLDGKTLRGVHGEGVVRHLFSATIHETQRLLAQIGVTSKENEISSFPRLLQELIQSGIDLSDLIFTGDAILTQRNIVRDIYNQKAHYLLTVKGNQQELKEILDIGFHDSTFNKQTFRGSDYRHGRMVKTTVEITNDFDMEYLRREWKGIAWAGRIIREGKRRFKIPGRSETVPRDFYEETYFISSIPHLTAEQAAEIIKSHWGIENNLHWQKDWTYLEDRQTLRKGNAPQIMSLIRSTWIGVMRELGITNISETLRSFILEPTKHRQFLKQAYVFA